MKHSLFCIQFTVGESRIHAFCFDEAKILAQAKRIRAGKTYTDVIGEYILLNDKWTSRNIFESK